MIAVVQAALLYWNLVYSDAIETTGIANKEFACTMFDNAVASRNGLVGEKNLTPRIASNCDVNIRQRKRVALLRSFDCQESRRHRSHPNETINFDRLYRSR